MNDQEKLLEAIQRLVRDEEFAALVINEPTTLDDQYNLAGPFRAVLIQMGQLTGKYPREPQGNMYCCCTS